MVALSETLGMKIETIGVNNAFQCVVKQDTKDSPPLYLTMPPLYIAWFCKYFPYVQVKGNGSYVFQFHKQIQGMKETVRELYQLIKAIFEDIGVNPNSDNGNLYAFAYKDKYLFFYQLIKMKPLTLLEKN